MAEFILKKDGLQDRFLASRTKVQIYGGGFGNGKTTGAIIKALQLSQEYPGFNCLMARSTYTRLNDTVRREFLKWCPKEWIKSFPMSPNSPNLCTLKNGSEFPFRYVSQQGRTEESTTSNLLSASYDCVLLDQAEDPEIQHKDFLDLLGRLRGQTIYRGDDPTMPRTGPRWLMLTLNPSRNWVYHELVKPLHDYQERGIISDKLFCLRDENDQPILDPYGKPHLLVSLVEGSTFEASHVLPKDFIETNYSAFRGQMRDRYLYGKWAAYEGLVYPEFDEQVHMIGQGYIRSYLRKLQNEEYDIEWIEGYDYGIAAPSCYLLSFVDPHGNVIICDGYYQKEYSLAEQYPEIKRIRREWGCDDRNIINADPDIFRRKAGKSVGTTVADLFWSDGGIMVGRASNDITHGITKVSGYLAIQDSWSNPITLDSPSPRIFFSDTLSFISAEMAGYFWRKNSTTGEREDMPQDGNDHSLDTIKYLLTNRPSASELKPSRGPRVPAYMYWHEQDQKELRSRRYG